MFKIKVPASSANIGPGFDSAGIAVGRYLELTVTKSDHWAFKHTTDTIPEVRHYKDHYIYKVATKVAGWHDSTLPPSHVEMYSDIPLARGLGSSASAIIAGIELANILGDLQLTAEDKLAHAVQIEGHPDNVAPALFGGFVVAVKDGEETYYKKLPALQTDLVIYIPNFELKTTEARNVLPSSYAKEIAAEASAIANVMFVALLTEDYTLAGQMMEKDLFHERYRADLIPNYAEIRRQAKASGAFGTVISGAGPTMISFVPKGQGQAIADKMLDVFPDYEIENISLVEEGLQTHHF